MKLLPSIAMLIIATSCFNCQAIAKDADGPDITRALEISEFHEISASSSIIVVYKVGAQTSVSVTAPESIIDAVSVKVNDGTLECGFTDDVTLNNRQVVVNVTASDVREFEAQSCGIIRVATPITSSGEVEAEASSSGSVIFGQVNAVEFSAQASSSGSISADVKANAIEVEASSSGSIVISCQCTALEVEASSAALVTVAGSSNSADVEADSSAAIDLSGLAVTTGTAKATSTGTITVADKSKYNISTSSGGRVR